VKHIFLVGGCDGEAKLGRDYSTEFVEKAPNDTLILTLALRQVPFQPPAGQAGRYRRHSAPARHGPVQRRLLGHQSRRLRSRRQFSCGVNDLPLSLILSWYELKAVCILLTLLALGIKNIRIGPVCRPSSRRRAEGPRRKFGLTSDHDARRGL
jgi:hydroxylamine reductase